MLQIMLDVFVDSNQPNVYFMFDRNAPILRGYDMKSWKDNNRCFLGGAGNQYFFPIKEVSVPLFNQTLQYPIVLEPIQ